MCGYNAEMVWHAGHAAFVGGSFSVMQQRGLQVGCRIFKDELKPGCDGDTLAAKRAVDIHNGEGASVAQWMR